MGLFKKEKLEAIDARKEDSTPRQTVMIVDDEAANRSVMASILSPYYNLIEARDGEEALQLVESLNPELPLACIVSDQRMPKLTGIELFQRIQRMLPSTVRIIVTGYVDVDSIVDSINKAEIYKFIVKPFDANDFLLTVRRGVESYQLRNKLEAYYEDLANQVHMRTRELEESRAQLLEANKVLTAEIGERRRAEAILENSTAQILALYNNASCGYHAVDRDGIVLQMNDTLLGWLGAAREDVVGRKRFQDLVVPDSWQAFLERHPEVRRDGWRHDLHDVEFELAAASGRVLPVLLHAVALEEDGAPVCRFTVFDITQRKQAQQRVEFRASHDTLTGLPNRALLQDRLERDILHAQRNSCQVAVMFIDLDGFKQINDTRGHHIGDRVLEESARRLQGCVRRSDSVARIGGDEFVISLPELGGPADAAEVARKVLACLDKPFVVDGLELKLSGSVGVSLFPGDGDTVETLIRNADTAMYRAKQGGRNNCRFYAETGKSQDATASGAAGPGRGGAAT